MDPYDQPSSTTVSDCLKHWGTTAFEDAFLTELGENEQDLPLQAMCLSGGYPSVEGWAVLDDLKIVNETKVEISGSFNVSFTEESPTGCRDVQWKDKRSGRIEFSLNLTNGEVIFEPPRIRREYEPDEF